MSTAATSPTRERPATPQARGYRAFRPGRWSGRPPEARCCGLGGSAWRMDCILRMDRPSRPRYGRTAAAMAASARRPSGSFPKHTTCALRSGLYLAADAAATHGMRETRLRDAVPPAAPSRAVRAPSRNCALRGPPRAQGGAVFRRCSAARCRGRVGAKAARAYTITRRRRASAPLPAALCEAGSARNPLALVASPHGALPRNISGTVPSPRDRRDLCMARPILAAQEGTFNRRCETDFAQDGPVRV